MGATTASDGGAAASEAAAASSLPLSGRDPLFPPRDSADSSSSSPSLFFARFSSFRDSSRRLLSFFRPASSALDPSPSPPSSSPPSSLPLSSSPRRFGRFYASERPRNRRVS